MTIQEYLEQYADAGKRAARYRKEYEAERKKLGTVRAGVGDGTPRSGKISKPTEQQATRLAEKAEKWKEAELDAIEKRQQVFDVVIQIPGIEGDVLYHKYIKLMKWEEIALELHYSVRGIWYAHGRALRMVEEIITPFH